MFTHYIIRLPQTSNRLNSRHVSPHVQLEHASLTDMYSATENAPTERTCHSRDCHARALSLFRSRSCELKGGKSLPTSGLRLQPGCEATLAHSAGRVTHLLSQGGLGGRIFGTALLVRCLLEASAENKNSKTVQNFMSSKLS